MHEHFEPAGTVYGPDDLAPGLEAAVLESRIPRNRGATAVRPAPRWSAAKRPRLSELRTSIAIAAEHRPVPCRTGIHAKRVRVTDRLAAAPRTP